MDRAVGKIRSTKAAHILPFSLSLRSQVLAEVTKSERIWEVINRFGGIGREELDGDNINRIDNVVTLGLEEHSRFRNLDTWLTEIEGQPNTYRMCKADWVLDRVLVAGQIITFHTTDPNLPVPNPRYPALHAACARVINACGITNHIDQILSDMEELQVLPEDGLSDTLMFALRGVAVC